MLTFKLIEKCFQDASLYKDQDVDFLLEESDWNDFGFLTSFHLHMTRKLVPESAGAIYLGPINIMRLGQKEYETDVLRKALLRLSIKKSLVFTDLPKDFFSITFSIDLFKSVSKSLKTQVERILFIKQLRLILKTSDEFYNCVKDEDIFKKSLLRTGTMDSFFLLKGRELLLMEGCQYNLRKKDIIVNYANSDTKLKLDFSSVKETDSSLIPNGVISFIGKNGSGKSTALYKLAFLLYTNPSDRDRYLKTIGTLTPSNLGISQLMIFSYSPFDNFTLPGELCDSDLKSWMTSIDSNSGRLVYCGLRDVKYEVETLLAEKKNVQDKDDELNMRLNDIRLKPLSALSDESLIAYKQIQNNDQLQNQLNEFLESAEIYQNDLYLLIQELETNFLFDQWNSFFNQLSTGHKFFIHAMLHIIAYCEENAMLLFDEPENHLQAPLLSFLMAEIRKVLYKRKSVMLIATHSPVVLQEMLSNNVRIVRREADKVFFSKPRIETFGESFGTISSEVFDLTTDRTYYFKAIDNIYELLKCDDAKCVKDAVDRVEQVMGGISNQTIHYVIAKYTTNKDIQHVEN